MRKELLPLAALWVLVLASCTKNGPEGVVDKFYGALQKSDYAAALAYTNVPPEDVPQVAEIMKCMEMDINAYEVLSSEVDEGDTTASVYLNTKVVVAGSSDTIEATPLVRCIKSGGQWKVIFL